MSTATELREQLQAKVAAMPLGMLLAAHDDLSARPDRDDAEKMVNAMMAGEVAKHLRLMVAEHSTPSLLADFRKYMAMDYKAAKASDKAAYWAVSEALEDRFPLASAAANEWLDSLAKDDPAMQDSHGWDKYLLALIETELAA